MRNQILLLVLGVSLQTHAQNVSPTYSDQQYLTSEWDAAQGFAIDEMRQKFSETTKWSAHCLQFDSSITNASSALEPFVPPGTALQNATYVDGTIDFSVKQVGEHGFNIHIQSDIRLGDKPLDVLTLKKPGLLHCTNMEKDCRSLVNKSESIKVQATDVINPEFAKSQDLQPEAELQSPTIQVGKLQPDFLVARISGSINASAYSGYEWQRTWGPSKSVSYSAQALCELRPLQP